MSPVTCWVLDHPAHVQLLAPRISAGSATDVVVVTQRVETAALLKQKDGHLPNRKLLAVPRPAGKLLPLQREWRAWQRMRKVTKTLKRRRILGHPVERIICKGAPLELRAAKRAGVAERWYLSDTEVNHLAHSLALPAVTDVLVPAVWRDDLDGGFLAGCKKNGIKIHRFHGQLPHAYLDPSNPNLKSAGSDSTSPPRIVYRELAGGGVHDAEEVVSAKPLLANLGMEVTTVCENVPIVDPWGLPSMLPAFDGVLSESVTLAHEAVCQGVPTLLVSKAKRGFLDPFAGGGLLFQIESTQQDQVLTATISEWREAVLNRRRAGASGADWSDISSELARLWG